MSLTEPLHHAYCLSGERRQMLFELRRFLETELDFKTRANPDFWLAEFDTFTLDDARALINESARRATVGDRRIFVVATNFIIHEAEQALLKLLEEPNIGNHFFLVLPSADILIDTLRSRLAEISSTRDISQDKDLSAGKIRHSRSVGADFAHPDPELFLSVTASRRLETVKTFLEALADDEVSRQEAIVFLNQLEQKLRGAFAPEKFTAEIIFAFDELSKARSYLYDRSPSVKILLEHVALLLPLIPKT